MCTQVEVLSQNCENKALVSTDFKIFFVWLTGMKQLFFLYFDFFGSGQDLMDQKMTGAKKVTLMKNHFCHARQPREEFFEFCSFPDFIFMADF